MTMLLEHKPSLAGAVGIGVEVTDHEGATPLHKVSSRTHTPLSLYDSLFSLFCLFSFFFFFSFLL